MSIRACCPTAFPMPAKLRNTTRSTPRSGSSRRRAPISPTPVTTNLCATNSIPCLTDIIAWHARGTRYGIKVDPSGLLASGEPGVQLTWMDAKVGDWVVTPRRGKPVEIQALWYNALCIMEDLARRFGDEPARSIIATWPSSRAGRSIACSGMRKTGCLYDVSNGGPPDASIRPNQIFAVSLAYSMLSAGPSQERSRESSGASADSIRLAQLLRPAIRSIADATPAARIERDGAYHQGTVWPWLLGPFITAYVKVNGGTDAARGRRPIGLLRYRSSHRCRTGPHFGSL